MPRVHTCLAAAVLAGALAAGCRRRADSPVPAAPRDGSRLPTPRTGALAMASLAGDGPSDRAVGQAQHEASAHPSDPARFVTLGRAWIAKAREAQDPGFYAQADDAARRALELAPEQRDARELRTLVLLQGHRFREARDAARALERSGSAGPDTYGLLSDALTELGEYDAAVQAAQNMVDLRPDSQSYVRVAWLRWLHGDAPGALEVMRLALDALPRSPEARAWIVTQAGVLRFNSGDLAGAQQYLAAAVAEYAPFAAAHAGLARVALARGDSTAAITEAEAALRASPSAEHEWLAGDAYAAAGRSAEATAHYAALERIGRRTDPRTLALYLASSGRAPGDAVALARREASQRGDVFTDDALAWALFRDGQLGPAREAAARARRLGTPDARMFFHDGMIRRAAEDRVGAAESLRRALEINPGWDPREADAARRTLRDLGGAVAAAAAGPTAPRP